MQVFKLDVLLVFFKAYLKLLVYFDFKLSTEHSIESIKLKKIVFRIQRFWYPIKNTLLQ